MSVLQKFFTDLNILLCPQTCTEALKGVSSSNPITLPLQPSITCGKLNQNQFFTCNSSKGKSSNASNYKNTIRLIKWIVESYLTIPISSLTYPIRGMPVGTQTRNTLLNLLGLKKTGYRDVLNDEFDKPDFNLNITMKLVPKNNIIWLTNQIKSNAVDYETTSVAYDLLSKMYKFGKSHFNNTIVHNKYGNLFQTVIKTLQNKILNYSKGTTINIDHLMRTYHSLGRTMILDHSIGTTMHPDHMMGTHHSLRTTMHPDHMMGSHHSLRTTMHPDHMMATHHSLGTTMHPDHILDQEINNDMVDFQDKMRSKVKSDILGNLEEDIEEDIEREEKILQSLESYHSSCGNPELEMLKQTCHPLTSYKTSSFEKAKTIRTPYDKHWLMIYNGLSLHENYSLDDVQSIP